MLLKKMKGADMRIKPKDPPPKGAIGPRVNFLSRLVRRRLNEAIAEEGVFSGQQDIIFAIAENEGITSSELASRAGVSPATISVSVKRMEKAGLIVKKPDMDDARILRLYPTDRAKQIPANVRKKMDELELKLKQGMTEEQALEFSDLLSLAINNLLDQQKGKNKGVDDE